MLFKNRTDREQYAIITGEYATESNLLLKMWVENLDKLSGILGFGEITVTSYIRPENKFPGHREGRAVDIRIKDKSDVWYQTMVGICRNCETLNPRFHINPHYDMLGTPHAHIHLEVRKK